MPSTKPQSVNPVKRLREKLAANRQRALLNRHWCALFFPALSIWTALVFVVIHLADWQWHFGPVLTVYFSGVTLLVLWAEHRANTRVAQMPDSDA